MNSDPQPRTTDRPLSTLTQALILALMLLVLFALLMVLVFAIKHPNGFL
jgi:hypothetical protein